MKEIKYETYNEDGDNIPKEIKDLILKKSPYFDEIDYSNFVIRNVESPFILADNNFDLAEANNEIIEIGVDRTKCVTFTGGSMYIEFVKNSDQAIIVHGNPEEGFNIFILN